MTKTSLLIFRQCLAGKASVTHVPGSDYSSIITGKLREKISPQKRPPIQKDGLRQRETICWPLACSQALPGSLVFSSGQQPLGSAAGSRRKCSREIAFWGITSGSLRWPGRKLLLPPCAADNAVLEKTDPENGPKVQVRKQMCKRALVSGSRLRLRPVYQTLCQGLKTCIENS